MGFIGIIQWDLIGLNGVSWEYYYIGFMGYNGRFLVTIRSINIDPAIDS
jgi:hypothetical protein